ncbi:hypothetical protein L4Z64_001178 [Pseudomonas aeruginosa]|nr:hypothetical protein [Pseudomonas aeruginosa]
MDDLSTLFQANDGNLYVIEVDEDGSEITVSRGVKRLGEIRLDRREDDFGRGEVEYFHITHLALERCKGLGIGRACLKHHIEMFGLPITAGSAHLGHAQDGSHLTGDGVPFIARMREEGIVEP